MAKRSLSIAERLLGHMGDELEQEYRRERREAAETLHNRFAEAIGELRPSVETLLYVLDMMRFDILSQRNAETFGPGSQVEVVPSDGKVSAIGLAVM